MFEMFRMMITEKNNIIYTSYFSNIFSASLLQYSLANSREERRNLFLVLFDYVLHQINESCITTGGMEYSDDEIHPLAALFSLANAPEAFYISVKLGVEGVGEILKASISSALCRYPNSERLNLVRTHLNLFL